MIRFVIDASVAVKWIPLFASEPLVSQARRCLDRRSVGEIAMLVPDLFWPEVANVLRKAVNRGMCKSDEAAVALDTIQGLDLPTVSSLRVVNPALSLALKYGRSIYDSMYVALAVNSNAQFLTADEKLANAVAAHLPVKWLGAM